MLHSASFLFSFYNEKEFKLSCDMSPYGIGAVCSIILVSYKIFLHLPDHMMNQHHKYFLNLSLDWTGCGMIIDTCIDL